ncbi:MAG: hypothetical protein QW333_01500 [Fervidicoccaceae archaeon]
MKVRPLWLEKSISSLVRESLKMEIGEIGNEDLLPPSIVPLKNKIVERLNLLYSKDKKNDESFTCLICYRSGFTKKGLYYHLLKVHKERLMDEVTEIVEESFRSTKNE